MPLVVRSLSDQLLDVIRGRILSGAIAPDAPLRQDALAAELGVSKIPLREALRRLEQDGLLRASANKGFFAASMTIEDAEEVFALRLRLEPEAAAAASLKATDTERCAARDALAVLNREMAAQGASSSVANLVFHMALVRPARKPVTAGIVERLHLLADRYVRKHLEPEGRRARARREHEAILNAWLARDAGRAAELIRSHVSGTLKDLKIELARQSPKPARRRRNTPSARS
ncbi:MAG TPA: GntR family transcriptional regulator [Rhizomicrobium sp.]|jgi:DNA-binding GntR family transcriptional regulator|nr:GntR family transcriptional regulator [Rhizomicrobium sp.]